MDGDASALSCGESDYGSSISSDEEVSLTQLLQQAPLAQEQAPLDPNPALQLIIPDIEDHESQRSARLPRRLGHERKGGPVWMQKWKSSRSYVQYGRRKRSQDNPDEAYEDAALSSNIIPRRSSRRRKTRASLPERATTAEEIPTYRSVSAPGMCFAHCSGSTN